MSAPILNMKTVEFFLRLENDYQLLSGDMVHQDELFEMQELICDEIVKAVNANKTGYGVNLLKRAPYLFQTEVVKL